MKGPPIFLRTGPTPSGPRFDKSAVDCTNAFTYLGKTAHGLVAL